MRLLHTADWHIGQIFFEYDRQEEHLQFLAWLKLQVRETAADALLVAGDVFDGPNPSAVSQKMFYKFLREVTAENPQLQVVIIAGNHDSAARLEAPNPLLEEMCVTIRGVVRRTPDGAIDYPHLMVPLRKGNEIAAWCLAVPYLRQGDYPDAENYGQGVGKLYEELCKIIPDKTKPVIAMGHLHATGAEISENDRSERIIIGGLECVPPDTFSREIACVALGHLHRAQQIAGRTQIRYAGSPLPVSFAEKRYRQGINLIEITENDVKIERIAFDAPVKLLSIPDKPATLREVLAAISLLPDGAITARSPYLEIKVLMKEPEPSLRRHIEEALNNKSVRLARIAAVTPENKYERKTLTCEELQEIHPMDMALHVFRQRFGGEEMPDAMKTLLQGVIQETEQ
ncbi:MAG: exonuclease SbcCD subunit D C-terminal domain-containing protein [Bacteroidales bacterium]|nr:exonuclease SbcCD subunit D C-terminal domain-containing protein [Bacteroidales bacterium]